MKKFAQWIQNPLLSLVVPSEPLISEDFCRALFHLEYVNESFFSAFHDADFFLSDLITFLESTLI